MSYSVKEHVAECYRRAEDYKRLYHRASSLDERELYLATRRDFLRLAEDLDRTLLNPKRRRLGKARNARGATRASTRTLKRPEWVKEDVG